VALRLGGAGLGKAVARLRLGPVTPRRKADPPAEEIYYVGVERFAEPIDDLKLCLQSRQLIEIVRSIHAIDLAAMRFAKDLPPSAARLE
jgi:hypothetical protein